MARLSKKHKTVISKIITRWAHTIAGTRPFNLERVREILRVAYKHETKEVRVKKKRVKKGERAFSYKKVKLGDPTIHVVRSPMAFKIAAAVLRGAISKETARNLARLFELDASFVEPLRRDAMRGFGLWWNYCGGNDSPLHQVWDESLRTPMKAAQLSAFDHSPINRTRRGQDQAPAVRRHMAMFDKILTDIPEFDYSEANAHLVNNHQSLSRSNRKNLGRAQTTHVTFGNFYCKSETDKDLEILAYVPSSSRVQQATFDRMECVPLRDSYYSSYYDGELLLNVIGATALENTWRIELMHEASQVMTFCKSVLVLAESPTVKRNSDGEIHCEDGPAVTWSDGAKQYYIDGHALGTSGRMICETPEQITLSHIQAEQNEEIKRILIERYGWGKYLHEIGAKVLDRRENYVDNTIEALVEITLKRERHAWAGWNQPSRVEEFEIKQRKLILSCRSTARQYFLAVPEDIDTCEAGQKWMSGGAETEHVTALKYPVRLVGAS